MAYANQLMRTSSSVGAQSGGGGCCTADSVDETDGADSEAAHSKSMA